MKILTLLLGALVAQTARPFRTGRSYCSYDFGRKATVVSLSAVNPPKKLVIIGGGIGGLASAFDARHLLRKDDEVVVILERAHFQFTLSNPWIATRQRKPEDISVDLTKTLHRHNIQFVHGKVIGLSPVSNQLRLANSKDTIDYDFLIVAAGPRLAFEEVRGLKNAGFSVCTTPHASAAADAHELKKRGGKALVDKIPFTFVTSEPYVGHLGLGGTGDSAKILRKLIDDKGVYAIENARITRVTDTSVSVEQVDERGHRIGIQTVPSVFSMIIPPFRGHDFLKRVPKLTDDKGVILVNELQQSPIYPNVFGVSVCVHIPPYERTSVPIGVPKTGYMIESMGTAAVKNIRKMIDSCNNEQNKID